jgi:hypothetical protein
MPGCYSTISYPPLIRRLGRCKQIPITDMIFVSLIYSRTRELIGLNSNRRHPPIYILNDDVFLNIFHLYRLAYPDQWVNETGDLVTAWNRQQWWYSLAHVCRRWRNIILESPSQLDLHLFCTNGVPVADMLAHSPPLPLTLCYNDTASEITAEDESGILLALSYRDRMHHISFWMFPNVGKFVSVMDDQFPILERMYIHSWTGVVLPVSFQAPNLRFLELWSPSIPIGPPLLTTSAAGLVTLGLYGIPASAYFPPSYILTRLSLMLQLEMLTIRFKSPIPNRNLETQSHQTLDMVILPNLRRFVFQGVSDYLEALVAPISAPSLNILDVHLFNQLLFIFSRLLQFIQTSENLTFTAVQVNFNALAVSLYALPWTKFPLVLRIACRHLDWQVASAVQIVGTLLPILSIVEQVTFSYEEHNQSESHNVDRGQWRDLLRPFTNAKTIRVQDDLVTKIFRSLPSGDGEPPLELLPNLEEVEYSGGSDARDAFTAFLNERQVSGHPVSLRLVDRSTFDIPKNP